MNEILDSSKSFTDWFAKNTDSVNAELILCIVVFIIIKNFNFIDPLISFVVNHFLNVNICWLEFMLIHIILLIFITVFITRLTFEVRFLNNRENEYAHFNAYLNESQNAPELISKTIKPSPRKHKLLFLFCALSGAALFIVFDWFQYIQVCKATGYPERMPYLEIICYFFIVIRLSFYIFSYSVFKVFIHKKV
jgi:hypothetical protein